MSATIVYGQNERLLPWAAEKIGVPSFRADAQAIGIERDGQLCAVVVFDTFGTADANIHIASDGTRKWISRELIARTFWYPFVQLKLNRLTGLVAAGNEDALRFDEHIGFVREGCHPQAGPKGEDLISLGLLRKNCRWIPKEFRT